MLQRDMPVPVWGSADAGAKVTVELTPSSAGATSAISGSGGQLKSTTADANGKWKLELDPLSASFHPAALRVTSTLKSKVESKTCEDVLVGEVWICSGQSNMQFGVGGVPEVKALIPKARSIRSFAVKRTVAFDEQDYCEGEWIDRYPDSAVAFGFAYNLQVAADVPVGIILTAWGSSSLEAWMPRDMVDIVPHFKTMMEEFDANAEAQNQIKTALSGPKPWSKSDDVFLRRQSNILYNAMMHPLAPYACRGLVWYQGERNTQSMHGMVKNPWFSRNSGMRIYGDVLKQWMQRYRQQWNRDDFHFLVVMLPGLGNVLKTSPDVPKDNPAAHSWAWMREVQLQALELSNVGVANTIDLGDIKNIHPKDKLPVGERLALLAARDTLGQQLVAQGPVVKGVKAGRGSLAISFVHADGLKTSDDQAPNGFWLADDSGKWARAEATIEGQSVVLKSSKIKNPLYVRYAFVGKPNVNLVNGANLPAYPFRTDDFQP